MDAPQTGDFPGETNASLTCTTEALDSYSEPHDRVDSTPRQSGNERAKKKDPLLEALIEEYYEMRERFEDQPNTSAVFRDLAEIMCIRGFPVSGEDCKRKFDALKQVFRRLHDMSGKTRDSLSSTGQGGNTWPYYEDMLKIHVGNVTTTAPVTLAAGSAAAVRRQVKRHDHEQATKRRPTSALTPRQQRQKERLMASARPLLSGTVAAKKQAELELRERKIAAEERFVEKFSAYRRGMEERSIKTAEYIRMLAELRAKK